MEISKDTYSDISAVYHEVTDGAYHDPETPASEILEEFRFRFGNIAKLALDLEDDLDTLFSECETVDDCKDMLADYFGWDEY